MGGITRKCVNRPDQGREIYTVMRVVTLTPPAPLSPLVYRRYFYTYSVKDVVGQIRLFSVTVNV